MLTEKKKGKKSKVKANIDIVTKRIVISLMVINMLIVGASCFTLYGMGQLISKLNQKIEVYEIQRQNRISELEKDLSKIVSLTMEYLDNQTKLISIVAGHVDKILDRQIVILEQIDKKYKELNGKILNRKKIDLDNVDEIKKANFYMLNITRGCSGSGTYIEIKNNPYILTCAHLLDMDEDIMFAVSDKGTYYPLTLIKKNKKDDLALFSLDRVPGIVPVEISKEEPKEGSELIIVGNPAGLKDVVTCGVVAKTYKRGYLFTNKIYFGNSGGAVLYKGKIIGVASQIHVRSNGTSIFVNYGYSSNLVAIKEFLKEII